MMSKKNKETLSMLVFLVMLSLLFLTIKAYEVDKITTFNFLMFTTFDLCLARFFIRKIEKGGSNKK